MSKYTTLHPPTPLEIDLINEWDLKQSTLIKAYIKELQQFVFYSANPNDLTENYQKNYNYMNGLLAKLVRDSRKLRRDLQEAYGKPNVTVMV